MHAPQYGLRILEHTLPPRLVAGETCGDRLTVQNTGTLTWRMSPPDGHPVNLFVLVGEPLYKKLPLPHGDVAPGGLVTFHFALRLPREGKLRVRLELIHELCAWFSHHGCPSVDIEVEAEAPSSPGETSAIALERSLARNLWHYQ